MMRNESSNLQPAGGLRNRRRRGNAIVELGLLAMPLTVMLMGTVVIGLNLGRSIQASQVNRDAGSMYVRGIDFSAFFNRNILVRLGQGLGLQHTGGRGVVYFSKVTWVPSSKCTDLSLDPCNRDQHVIVQRLVIGDPALRASTLGTPNPTSLDSKGLVGSPMTDGSALAYFPWMQLTDNEFAYVAETYFDSPDFDLPGFHENTGVYNISVY
jgi:hypothetical protein